MTRRISPWLPLLACLAFAAFIWMLNTVPSRAADSSGASLRLPGLEGSAETETEEEKKKKKKIAGGQPATESTDESSLAPLGPEPAPGSQRRSTMPAAPTYMPNPFGDSPLSMPPTQYGPLPPTGFGGYEGPLSFDRQPSRSATGSGLGIGLGAGGAPSPFGPFMNAPTLTPSASAGAAAVDPALGRYASFAVPQSTGALGPRGRPPSAPASVGSKPFGNYTPAPTISPYMNLYREGVTGIDNYNALVRPVIEQQQRNQRTQRELSRLQQSTRAQSSNLQRLNQRTNPYQRAVPSYGSGGQQGQRPAGYMNYHQYYPGFGRR